MAVSNNKVKRNIMLVACCQSMDWEEVKKRTSISFSFFCYCDFAILPLYAKEGHEPFLESMLCDFFSKKYSLYFYFEISISFNI